MNIKPDEPSQSRTTANDANGCVVDDMALSAEPSPPSTTTPLPPIHASGL
ncbi:hypothetical protein D8B26_002115 [Coccidioides posadasii str. Silveira]|nr:hypothetical protein D8B26_002115 [Coccidioides posadasii str. Silveira]